MDKAQLFELFRCWLNGPDTAPHKKAPAAMGALENGLWVAYCAGYEQAAKDSEAARRLVDFLKGQ